MWSANGRELFYLDAKNLLTVVPVQRTATTFAADNPHRILDKAYYPGFTSRGIDLRGYDVSGDGQRFLMIKEAGANGQPPPPASLVFHSNWTAELRERLSKVR
jgi:hypothetical protein